MYGTGVGKHKGNWSCGWVATFLAVTLVNVASPLRKRLNYMLETPANRTTHISTKLAGQQLFPCGNSGTKKTYTRFSRVSENVCPENGVKYMSIYRAFL